MSITESVGSGVEVRECVMPLLVLNLKLAGLDEQGIVHIPFTQKTSIRFFLDRPDGQLGVTKQNLSDWKVTSDQLDSWARANVQRRTDRTDERQKAEKDETQRDWEQRNPSLTYFKAKIELLPLTKTGGVKVGRLEGGDGFNASSIFLEKLRDRFGPYFQGDFYVLLDEEDPSVFVALERSAPLTGRRLFPEMFEPGARYMNFLVTSHSIRDGGLW